MNRLLQLLNSLLLMLRTQTSLKACRCPLCLFISSPLKIRVLTGDWSASLTAQAIESVGMTIERSSAVLSQTLKQNQNKVDRKETVSKSVSIKK